MKKRNVLLTTCFAALLTMTLIVMNSGVFHAITKEELSAKDELYLQGIGGSYARGGEDRCYAYIESFNGSIPTEVIQIVVDAGYLNNHVEELKTLGYTNVDYSAATGSSNAATPTQTQPVEPAKTPEPFTVETYNPAKTMWAIQIVNCREGASTEYNKVGSLKEHEQVNVTGVASTGWYQITKEDGNVMYVSNKYLTEEDPTTQTVYKYDEEDGVVETITVTGEDVEAVDKVVEEITATPEPTIESTPEHTAEPTPVPTPEPTAEPVIEESAENGINMWYAAGAVFVLFVLAIAIVMIVKKK
ncbi:MAG: SH3 domain-containing protein [Lachnospiraceae bacterium]|nr:SH3 domain-containing protein [Lachnospiraceae bacterium]MDD7628999.1 SH3 domain-containing protein [Lachnospiraceae bacterium]MDY4117673.1 SH3 domain-containing protein [Lachnospiraceae bacterium]